MNKTESGVNDTLTFEKDIICEFAEFYGGRVQFIASVLLACFGICINTGSAIVLTRTGMRRTDQQRQTTTILTALAVCDIATLATYLAVTIYANMFDAYFDDKYCIYVFDTGNGQHVDGKLVNAFSMIHMTLYTTSLCFVLLLAVYRYVTVAQVQCLRWSARLTKGCIVGSCVFAIILNIAVPVTRIRILFFFKGVACLVIAILSVLLISHVVKAKKSHNRVANSQVHCTCTLSKTYMIA